MATALWVSPSHFCTSCNRGFGPTHHTMSLFLAAEKAILRSQGLLLANWWVDARLHACVQVVTDMGWARWYGEIARSSQSHAKGLTSHAVHATHQEASGRNAGGTLSREPEVHPCCAGGAPERLVVLMEGESLFNDATSIVLFEIFFRMVKRLSAGHSASDLPPLQQGLDILSSIATLAAGARV